MDQDIRIGKANGVAFVMQSLIHGLLWLAIAISVIALIMVYVLGLGAWRLGGVPIIAIGGIALRAAVLIGIAYSAIFSPIATLAKKSVIKKAMYSDLVNLSERDVYEMRYMERFVNKASASAVAAAVLAALLAFFAHDPIMSALGNPAADMLTLAIVLICPLVLNGVIFFGTSRGMKGEDEMLYDSCLELVGRL